MLKKTKKSLAILALMGVGIAATAGACDSQANTVSKNVSEKADNFEVQRKIVGINTRTDKYIFYVEGKCSIERSNGDLIVICKEGPGPDDFKKHMIGGATDVAWVSTQMEPIGVDKYHTAVVLKPEGLIPAIDLQGSWQK